MVEGNGNLEEIRAMMLKIMDATIETAQQKGTPKDVDDIAEIGARLTTRASFCDILLKW